MNPPEHHIESTLRQAPQPSPPPGLRARIVAAIALPQAPTSSPATISPCKSWLRRWWPALATGGLAAVAFAMVVVQQTQIDRLERTMENLNQSATPSPAESPLPSSPAPSNRVVVPQPNGAADLESLRARAQELAADVKALEAMPAENAQLKQQAAANLGLSAEALEELAKAKETAQRITCINNLKQMGLAARIWAVDNGDVLPPDTLSMSNELATPKILICPADPGRQPASDWASFTPANSSYEFLAANGAETEPQRVAFRCPIHGSIGLVDGSVQSSVAKNHPEWLVARDGKLMLEMPAAPEESSAPAPAPAPPTDRRMMERYGLLPTGPATNPTAPGQPPAMSEEMRRRYGLLPSGAAPNPTPPGPSSTPGDQP